MALKPRYVAALLAAGGDVSIAVPPPAARSLPRRLSVISRSNPLRAARELPISIRSRRKKRAMRAAISRTATLSVAAAAVSIGCGVIGAPIAVAQGCPKSQMALDGTCIPISSPQNTAAAAAQPAGPVDDEGPPLNEVGPFDPSFFEPYFGDDSILAVPGFNRGGGFGGGGGGGHGR
jgi:hypothetical protein